MGEGWGESEQDDISDIYIPLSLISSRQGRGNQTFTRPSKLRFTLIERIMEIYFSDVFDIPSDDLEDHGAFNVSLVNDPL
jgi:hypothetical protein